MADCSTAGTVLDQVVAAATNHATSSSGAEGKAALTSLMGHAAVGGGAGSSVATAMPLAPPTALLPPTMRNNTTTTQQQQQHLKQAPIMMQQHQHQHPTMMQHPLGPMQAATSTVGPSPHFMMQQQQQQQMQMMAMMQMQMQQQQQWQRQRQQQQQQSKSAARAAAPPTTATTETPILTLDKLKEQLDQLERTASENNDPFYKHVHEEMHRIVHEYEAIQQEAAGGDHQKENEPLTLDNWTDGLEDDFALEQQQGVSMEDLAAAWAQAEAEYDQELVEDATNLAAGLSSTDQQQHHLSLTEDELYPYEFKTNIRSTTTTTEQQQLNNNTNNNNKNTPPDYLQIGMDAFDRGEITQAIESFETLLQTVDPDHAKAWFMLGKCHAENDMDRNAIACLERAVERDPYYAEAQLALGVSYVNELNHTKALTCLKHWITHNAEYAHLVEEEENKDETTTTTRGEELEQVQALLKNALALHAGTAPDIQEALGVVYNVSREYDSAVQCFQTALEARPADYALHNKLGATLANSNQSSDALHCYQRALALRPKYARAWLNMAISHSNLKQHNEAARCYLQTVSLNPTATHCWSYLRIALSCAERWDLLSHVSEQDLNALSKHYDFVMM